MERLLRKYAEKLARQGLCDEGAPLLGGLDAELIWNRADPVCGMLEQVVSSLNINSILFARPAEPYFSILNHLAAASRGRAPQCGDAIHPQDCETRTFLHDIPVSSEFSAPAIVAALKKRKSLFIPGRGIVTFGTVSPEQAFVTYSSVCFAGFVKFFSDHLSAAADRRPSPAPGGLVGRAFEWYEKFMVGIDAGTSLIQGPLPNRETVLSAMVQAGKLIVDSRMVDSYFGNISYRLGDTVYISQTASSLDELAGCIDACPLDGSSCAGITASSEYTAHKEILCRGQDRAVLHGHPKFAVIRSMYCEKKDCPCRDRCYKECPEERFVRDIPIVPGEVGTGPSGLCHTLPPAVTSRRGAMVYGHGLFTVGKLDFRDAYAHMLGIEKMCLEEYAAKAL